MERRAVSRVLPFWAVFGAYCLGLGVAATLPHLGTLAVLFVSVLAGGIMSGISSRLSWKD